MTSMCLAVYFDNQFWVGIVEVRTDDGWLTGRTIFGAEPSNAEILEFAFHGIDQMRLLPAPGSLIEAEQRSLMALSARRKAANTGVRSRRLGKTREMFSAALTQHLAKKESETRRRAREDREARYEKSREKKRKRHKGH